MKNDAQSDDYDEGEKSAQRRACGVRVSFIGLRADVGDEVVSLLGHLRDELRAQVDVARRLGAGAGKPGGGERWNVDVDRCR